MNVFVTGPTGWIGSASLLTARLARPLRGDLDDLEDVYRYHGIDTDSIVRAGLDLASR